MNFEVVKEIVRYARSLEQEHNKLFRFTITTNGLLLDDDKIDFINREMSNVVLSIDGRREVNDRVRVRVDRARQLRQHPAQVPEARRKAQERPLRAVLRARHLHQIQQGFRGGRAAPLRHGL